MKRHHFSDLIIKPEHCTLAFGIPTTVEDFIHDQDHQQKEFAKKFDGNSPRYDQEFLKHLRRTEPEMATLGVKIVHRLTLDDFGNLFHIENIHVIILFSHWREKKDGSPEAVEYFDGFATIPQIIEKIPPDFIGLLDLCVCHPTALKDALDENRPNCRSRSTKEKATPHIWLYFYWALFRHLAANEMNYLDALPEIIEAFLATTQSNERDL